MPMRDDRGFWMIDIPPLTADAMGEFDSLPLDVYTPGNHRFRRFSTFRMWHEGNDWRSEQQPQRAFLQPKAYNSLVGGVPRTFEPIRLDPTVQMASVFDQISLDRTRGYALNLHQIRIITSAEVKGVLVPEGPHRDGHALVLTAVFRRHNIDGGVSQLLPTGGGEPFFSTVLEPGQAMVVEDGRMWHHATDIVSRDGLLGYRDIWIVSINDWDARRYGEAFENRAMEPQ
jgi:hypothetical protein